MASVAGSSAGASSPLSLTAVSSAVFASAEVNVASSSDSLLGQATSKVSQALLSGSSDFKVRQ